MDACWGWDDGNDARRGRRVYWDRGEGDPRQREVLRQVGVILCLTACSVTFVSTLCGIAVRLRHIMRF